ncbi:hypothetical protein IG631_07697 [Alternaria alternata]|nr:hypothetical protein IG631_07697 [Alternaria alternata]
MGGILAFMMTTKDGYVEYTGLANRFLREAGGCCCLVGALLFRQSQLPSRFCGAVAAAGLGDVRAVTIQPWCLFVSKNTIKITTWVPPLQSFPTSSTQGWISLIDFGSYKWINPHLMSCSLAGSALKKMQGQGRWAEWSLYKRLLLEHWGLSSYTTQSFLFSPKPLRHHLNGAGLFSKLSSWSCMVLLLCLARL